MRILEKEETVWNREVRMFANEGTDRSEGIVVMIADIKERCG